MELEQLILLIILFENIKVTCQTEHIILLAYECVNIHEAFVIIIHLSPIVLEKKEKDCKSYNIVSIDLKVTI